jgi:multisubunit Na+/H+ antiporter MnhB subunit
VTNAHDQPGRTERPEPQYGEYAPPGWSWTPPEDAVVVPDPRGSETDPRPATAPSAKTVAHPVDRLITIVLLALGVFFAVPTLLDPSSFATTLSELYTSQGIGTYASPDLARTLGLVVALAQALIVAFAVWISIRRLRAGKRAVLVPILGIVATVVLSLTVAAIAILGDPTFADYVSRMSAGTGTDV